MNLRAKAIASFFGRILFSNDASPPASDEQREMDAMVIVGIFVILLVSVLVGGHLMAVWTFTELLASP
ncbi:MAG: hypothetical protein ABI604_09710 [Nitrospirota bacterium]